MLQPDDNNSKHEEIDKENEKVYHTKDWSKILKGPFSINQTSFDRTKVEVENKNLAATNAFSLNEQAKIISVLRNRMKEQVTKNEHRGGRALPTWHGKAPTASDRSLDPPARRTASGHPAIREIRTLNYTVDFMNESLKKPGTWFIGISAIVRVELHNNSFHEDVGFGQAQGVKGQALALQKAKREAVTNATKRALKQFGDSLFKPSSDFL